MLVLRTENISCAHMQEYKWIEDESIHLHIKNKDEKKFYNEKQKQETKIRMLLMRVADWG